jgi:hypothetical protein
MESPHRQSQTTPPICMGSVFRFLSCPVASFKTSTDTTPSRDITERDLGSIAMMAFMW